MNKSEDVKELVKALCEAQKELESIKKDAKNPFFKSSYSTLDQVWTSVKPILTKNGLCISQLMLNNNMLETYLFHTSGQWLSSVMPLAPSKANDMQSLGSAITYGRRQSLMAILSVPSGDDDDANAASDKQVIQEPRKLSVKP